MQWSHCTSLYTQLYTGKGLIQRLRRKLGNYTSEKVFLKSDSKSTVLSVQLQFTISVFSDIWKHASATSTCSKLAKQPTSSWHLLTSGTSVSCSGESPPSSLVFLFLLFRTLWMKFLWKSQIYRCLTWKPEEVKSNQNRYCRNSSHLDTRIREVIPHDCLPQDMEEFLILNPRPDITLPS